MLFNKTLLNNTGNNIEQYQNVIKFRRKKHFPRKELNFK